METETIFGSFSSEMQEMVRESHDKFMAAPKVGFAGHRMAKPERYLGTIRAGCQPLLIRGTD